MMSDESNPQFVNSSLENSLFAVLISMEHLWLLRTEPNYIIINLNCDHTGSSDLGPDPDWDTKNSRWTGNDRKS